MIPPLTKKNKDGNLYTRPSGILTAIDAAIQQDIGHIASACCDIESGFSRFCAHGMFSPRDPRSQAATGRTNDERSLTPAPRTLRGYAHKKNSRQE